MQDQELKVLVQTFLQAGLKLLLYNLQLLNFLIENHTRNLQDLVLLGSCANNLAKLLQDRISAGPYVEAVNVIQLKCIKGGNMDLFIIHGKL